MYAADARHENKALEDKLRRLYSLRGGPTIDLTIRPAYRELLARLGNPQLSLPPVIHVAGTNGKGSTIAIMRAVLEAAGYRVHVYTSPHLIKFNERIVLAGEEIGDDLLEALLDEVMAVNDGLPQTFFEITTALAFLAFARTGADAVLLETGLGGRLDSTNVIDRPAATVITPVSFDHQEYLGESLAAIAGEKAGIMKRSVPCVVAPQNDAVQGVIFESVAAQLSCPLYRCGAEWFIDAEPGLSHVIYGSERISYPQPVLPGPHQIENAATAVMALRVAGRFNVTQDDIAEGLTRVRWPARLQRLDHVVKPGWELWVDGAHNPGAALALSKQAAVWRKEDGKDLHLVFGMMKNRDPEKFLVPLIPYAKSIMAVSIPGEALAHDPAAIAACCPGVVAMVGVEEAVRALAGSDAGAGGRILITGSLYLSGYSLRLFT